MGYESEAAFNRAFRREFGLPPAQYRHKLRSSDAALPARLSRDEIEPDRATRVG